jgi:HNH endonuclease
MTSARKIIAFFQGRCAISYLAGERDIDHSSQLDIDHIIPRKEGGSDDASNLQILCTRCHHSKTVHDNLPYRIPLQPGWDIPCIFECAYTMKPDLSTDEQNDLLRACYHWGRYDNWGQFSHRLYEEDEKIRQYGTRHPTEAQLFEREKELVEKLAPDVLRIIQVPLDSSDVHSSDNAQSVPDEGSGSRDSTA